MPKIPPSALNKAMDLLAARGLSECELTEKLRRANYPDEEVTHAVEECRKRGYLNDALLAADCVDALRTRNAGARTIRQKLLRRGLNADDIDARLQADPSSEEEAARRALEGKLRSLTRESDPRKKREKLFRFLAGRGFSPGLIFKLLGEPYDE